MTTHRSPRGRLIDYLEGDAEAIIARGQEITDLGEAMASSAYWLEKIKTQVECDLNGKAIETLRSSIGDAGEKLWQASDLYSPVGPTLMSYGEEVERLQGRIHSLVDSCRDRAGEVPAVVAPEPEEPADEDPEAEQARQAQEAWEEKAAEYDAAYDEWEDAFDKAANGITEDTAGKIEDGFWRTFFAEAGAILEIAALIVAVLALVITGPVMFWVAIGVGLAALAMTIGQYCYGDKDEGDIALAALGVIPFGKLGTGVAKGARLFSSKAPTIFQGAGRFSPSLSDAPRSNRLLDTMMRGLSGKDVGDFHTDVAVLGGSNWGPDMAGAAINAIGGFAENGFKYYSGGVTVSGLVGA